MKKGTRRNKKMENIKNVMGTNNWTKIKQSI